MHNDRYVFSQLIDFLPKREFSRVLPASLPELFCLIC